MASPSKLFSLESERLILEPIAEQHVSARYVDWLNDPEVNQFLETKFQTQSLQTVRAFVREKMQKLEEPFFAIVEKLGRQHIGNIKLGPINPHHQHADISLFIGERGAWGKGFASEAISRLCDYAFRERKLEMLRAGAYAKNLGSIRAFEKAGFHLSATLPNYLCFEGQRMDLKILCRARSQV